LQSLKIAALIRLQERQESMGEATIRDVARHAQVSVASVSRVLNRLDNVSEHTRDRVLSAVKELGYVPHAGARSLSMARTGAIGVVLPNLHGEFFSEIMRGMDRLATARGYLLLLSNMHADTIDAAASLKAMRGRVDGLIVMAPHMDDVATAEALPVGTPAILLNTRAAIAGRPTIRLDNAAGARAVAEHLLQIGRKRIVHIAGPRGNIDAKERAEAFRNALSERQGVNLEVMQGDFYEESGRAAVKLLLDGGHSFDAIFAANDMMAIGALETLRNAGVAVPDEVAVAGFDDIPLSSHLGLTTVQVRIDDLGGRAIERLLDIVEGAEDHHNELHQPELVVRSTTVKT
jgi:LacI family transcriptional regulator